MKGTKETTKTVNGTSYLTIAGAAERLNVSEWTVRREVSRKALRVFRHPAALLFLPEWLDEWVESRTGSVRKARTC